MSIANAVARIFPRGARVAELEAQLAAKEQELREVRDRYQELRHRIRNDLQALMAYLSVQARVADEPEYCRRCILRVSAAAELHNLLDYEGTEVISMASFLQALSNTLEKAFQDRISIKTIVDPDINLDHRRAQCVGLIYAEAIMNALKHAFPNDEAGNVEVRFRRLGDTFEMTVSDNGVGFDPATTQPGHGIKLMKELAQQLQGALQLERLPAGARVCLTFAAAA